MFKAEKINKFLAVILTVSLLFFYTFSPILTYAQVVTPDPSITDTPTTIDNSATITSNTDTSSNTGDNAINPTDTPTPTPDPSLTPMDTPTDTPTPTPDPSLTPMDTPTSTPDGTNIQNNADASNNSSTSANSGENSVIATDSAQTNDTSHGNSDNSCQAPQGGGSASTGDAASVTNVNNSLNSTSLNSQAVYQTINLFMDSNGDINLSDPFTIAAAVIPQHPDDSTINVNVTNVNNYAYLNNNVVSYANTGNNTVNGNGGIGAAINTGDAYSLVSLINKVNFTIINSTVHIITINIFGNLNGNIILPDFNSTSSSCTTCGMSLNASNSATVTNNVNSQAISGQNGINGSGNITTGDANSTVNLLNLINSNFFGVNINGLFINVLGTWNGSFIGWGDMTPESGGASLNLYETGPPNTSGSSSGCSSCSSGNTNITNNAIVNNNVTSTANTGENTINGKGKITTGNAFSLVSIINFINTNFINSSGFFGFLNIFGNWTGNIGGKSNFAALNSNNDNSGGDNTDNSVQADSSQNNNAPQEQGGHLSVTNSNNVGAYVFPGDTITFSVKVKNTGSGKMYQTKLDLYLIKDGKAAGGTTFDLGDIDAGKGKTLTTGFVLSKNAPGGLYIARATATGNVGPDNNTVSAEADSQFNVLNNFAYTNNSQSPHVTVLGAHNKTANNLAGKNTQSAPYLIALVLVLLAYFLIKGIKKRRYLANLLSNTDFKTKLSSLRMFIF